MHLHLICDLVPLDVGLALSSSILNSRLECTTNRWKQQRSRHHILEACEARFSLTFAMLQRRPEIFRLYYLQPCVWGCELSKVGR